MSYIDCTGSLEYRVWGSNERGERFPLISGFAENIDGIALRIKDYKENYKCCHVNIDVAFPYDK